MNNSVLTIQAVGLGACDEVLSRFCFPSCTLKKKASLLPSGVGLGLFWGLVHLFTGVVAPTTCKSSTCLTTCMVKGFMRGIGAMVKGFMRRMAQCGEGFYAGITLPDHRDLWKAPLTRRVRAEKPSQLPSTARSLCPVSGLPALCRRVADVVLGHPRAIRQLVAGGSGGSLASRVR